MMKSAKDSLDIGVIVSDIGASLTFYRDILGLQFIGSVPVWFGTMHRLRFGTSDFKLIEPTTVPPPGALGLENQL
jgi:catechol 2,3-dioxygenase-like lactoylglutathione lyase family enzyme